MISVTGRDASGPGPQSPSFGTYEWLDGALALEQVYAYDDSGRLTGIATPAGVPDLEYAYDSGGRLESIITAGEAVPVGHNQEWREGSGIRHDGQFRVW